MNHGLHKFDEPPKISVMLTLSKKIFLLLFASLALITGLSAQSAGLQKIKTILIGGKITTSFFYNEQGQIAERHSLFQWERYNYDAKGRLAKLELAQDPALWSSGYKAPRSELMTPENFPMTSFYLFEYDKRGRLVKKKFYANLDQHSFEFRSMMQIEYRGRNIRKMSLRDTLGKEMQFTLFEYDQKGNVTNEKYFSLMEKGGKPSLISTTSYTCDNNPNPFQIHRSVALPPYDTNVNNITETRFANQPVKKSLFQYDKNGFPVKEESGKTFYEYRYE